MATARAVRWQCARGPSVGCSSSACAPPSPTSSSPPRTSGTSSASCRPSTACRSRSSSPRRGRDPRAAAMLERLDQVLSVLRGSARDLPERQRTIRSTMEWSIDLLGPFARALFMRLGVFVGDFSLDAVEAVASGEVWAVDLPGTCSGSSTAACCASTTSERLSPSSRCSSPSASSRPCDSRGADADTVRRAPRRLLRAPRRGDRTAAARVHAAGRVERVEAEATSPRGEPSPHRDRQVRHGADAAWRMLLYRWISNLLPTAEVLDGSPSRVRCAAHGIAVGRSRSTFLVLGRPRDPGVIEVDRERLVEAAALFHAAGDLFGEGAALTAQGIASRRNRRRISTVPRGSSAGRRTRHLGGRLHVQLPVPGPAQRHRASSRGPYP